MPDRGRHQNGEKYAEHRSRKRETSPNTHHHSTDDRDRNRRDREERTSPSYNDPPAHRDHPEPPRVYRETSVSSSEGNYYEPQSVAHTTQHRRVLYRLGYILSSRGLCQAMEVCVNLLIVICAGVPYSNDGGYRNLASLGGLYHYYYGGANAFTGVDADRVMELDRLYHQLKRPPYVFTMACGGALMAYACVMIALGVFRVPYHWPPVLLGEALLNVLIALGYIPALAFYFIKLQETYDTAICKEREELYKGKGHQGFTCQFNGADIAGGLFAIVGVILFTIGAVLAIRAFRSVRELKSQRATEDNNL